MSVNVMVGKCRYSATIYGAVIAAVGYPKSILEFGCGIGANIDRFRECSKKVGIDPFKSNIAVAKELFPWNDYILGDCTALADYKKNEFDVVVTCSVLDHIKDYRPVMDELMRVGKHCIFFEPMVDGQERQAFAGETFLWKTTWYHNYHEYLKSKMKRHIIKKCPLYDLNSGKRFKMVII